MLDADLELTLSRLKYFLHKPRRPMGFFQFEIINVLGKCLSASFEYLSNLFGHSIYFTLSMRGSPLHVLTSKVAPPPPPSTLKGLNKHPFNGLILSTWHIVYLTISCMTKMPNSLSGQCTDLTSLQSQVYMPRQSRLLTDLAMSSTITRNQCCETFCT